MIIRQLFDKKLLKNCPSWLPDNICYLTITGSISYGCADTNADKASDFDTIGICLPPKHNLFPHLAGHIFGFGALPLMQPGDNGSGVYQEHHVFDPDALQGKGRNYDINVYNIVKFVNECHVGNPNLIDSLFTNRECVLHCTQVGNILRENRKIFLAKNLWKTYKGYAYAQLHKADNKLRTKEMRDLVAFENKHSIPRDTKLSEVREELSCRGVNNKLKHLSDQELNVYYNIYSEGHIKCHRFESTKINQQETKFLYNIVRLINEAEQIFTTGDLDLMQNREQLKSIRRGEWTQAEIQDYVDRKEKSLEEIYLKSVLPQFPDEKKIKEILIECLEHHYQNLDDCVRIPDRAEFLIKEIKKIIESAGY